jgi:hypothetical protein
MSSRSKTIQFSKLELKPGNGAALYMGLLVRVVGWLHLVWALMG